MSDGRSGTHRFVEINHRFKKDIRSERVSAWIGPSSWMREQILRCRDFPAADVFVVPFACDFESFWPGNKAEDRKRLDLPVDHKLILFVAENLDESRKGFGDFERVLLRLHNLTADQPGTAPIGALLAGRTEGVEKGTQISCIRTWVYRRSCNFACSVFRRRYTPVRWNRGQSTERCH